MRKQCDEKEQGVRMKHCLWNTGFVKEPQKLRLKNIKGKPALSFPFTVLTQHGVLSS